jgi:putative PIN family toxin of toxin-antitoxin system
VFSAACPTVKHERRRASQASEPRRRSCHPNDRSLNDASAESAEKPLIIFKSPPIHKQQTGDMPPTPVPATPDDPVSVVIDTNVVLDLLVFGDVAAMTLAAHLHAGRLRPLATPAMLDELADVLSRPFLADWLADPTEVLRQARALCREVATAPALSAPRCTDPDDQKFVDLAWSWPARWLFSRDRAVLALARPAQAHGLGILTPAAWATSRAAGPAHSQA